MATKSPFSYQIAIRDFHRARREAAIQQILARVTGKSADLLCFDDVRQQLRTTGEEVERGLQEIPLDKIVGSVGRYKDFTRTFMPKRDSDEERWAQVKAATLDMTGYPPIELYQVDDAYFVKDGNHRVSVARQLGSETISAYVTEVKTQLPLGADDDPDEVLCKARYAKFLELTGLSELRPEADLLMTFAGHYSILLDQIDTEYHLLSGNGSRPYQDDLWPEAVAAWYDNVYMPVVQIIREMGLLREFPERMETDIYVLLSERRAELEEALGWHVDTETAVAQLATDQIRRPPLVKRLIDVVAPELDEGPPIGQWREQQLALHRENHLFADILVLLEGIEDDWKVLDTVIKWALWDKDRIFGLHVVKDRIHVNTSTVEHIRDEFERRCQAAGLVGEFAVEVGVGFERIVERAAWTDLVVINLTHPPESQPLARLRPGWGQLIQRCPRPILTLPNAAPFKLDRMLLAYDGSAKAGEALFVATYFAARWGAELTVLTVKTDHTGVEALNRAREYIEQNDVLGAKYILESEPIGDAILKTMLSEDIHLLIMGGFGLRSVRRLMLGSTVEQMLQEMRQPILICR
jgi:nucleotide-binding universal stress UspA family protein